MRRAAEIQLRVLGALILRETRTRFGKSQLGYLWAVMEPVAIVATFALAFHALGRPPLYGDSLFLFFTASVIPYHVYRRVTTFVASAVESNQALLAYPPVKPIDLFLARAGLEIATGVLVFMLMMGVLILFFDAQSPTRFHALAGSILAMSLLGFGCGVINAVVISRFESWKNIESMLARPLFFVSGIFFLPESLPEKVREYLLWNPVMHGVELMRYGYYFNYRAADLDVGYLAFWALSAALIGLSAERALRQTAP